MKKASIISLLIIFSTSTIVNSQTYKATWESLDNRPTPDWFEDAKFGIFIHWGLYSVPAWAPTEKDISVYAKYAEWYWPRITKNADSNPQMKHVNKLFVDHHNKIWGSDFKYQDFASLFKANQFNSDKWAEIIRAAGAKYVVLTSKHHEGFALWPSVQSNNWNSVDIGPHRDLCGELTSSVKEKGLKMGFYYSLYEWFNPLYKSNPSKYVNDYMIPQMKDLVTRYNPDVLWVDGEWDYSSKVWKSPSFLSWLYNDSAVKDSVVVNDRWGNETRGKHGDFYTTEYDLIMDGNASETKFEHPWEECRGIGGSFGYNTNENLEDYSSSQELVHILINKVASGGNLLLNIGPTADGRIPIIMQQRLYDIGNWLKINGDAIYGSRKWLKSSEVNNNTSVYFTTKEKDLFVIVTNWTNEPIVVEDILNAENVSLLGYSGEIEFSISANKLTIIPPILTPINNALKYAWVFKIKKYKSLTKNCY